MNPNDLLALLGRYDSDPLVEAALNHPELSTLRRWLLATDDAHGLYERSGFVPLRKPERWMEKHESYVEASS